MFCKMVPRPREACLQYPRYGSCVWESDPVGWHPAILERLFASIWPVFVQTPVSLEKTKLVLYDR